MADPSTASTAYIDRLPNEVLHRILSLVAYSFSPSVYVPPVFILRCVCRRFRMIACELDIWRDDTFNITHGVHLNPLGEIRWLRDVLLDDSLVRCLSRRTQWRFDSIEVFVVILVSIPEINQKTRTVVLNKFYDGIVVTIYRLQCFTFLVGLEIDVRNDMKEPIALTLIVECLPQLKSLILRNLTDYDGSLERADTLQLLCIEFTQNEWAPVEVTKEIFPSDSIESLTSFSLRYRSLHHAFNELDPSHLIAFHNLEHIKLNPLLDESCRAITQAAFTLTSLDLVLPADFFLDARLIGPMFSAQSLRFLQSLSFKLDTTFHDDYQLDEEIADEIISRIVLLHDIQNLELALGLRKAWCTRFGLLKNLRSLSYNYLDYEELELQDSSNSTRITMAESHARVGKLLDEAFVEFEHKPTVKLDCSW
jgi:hypothetical protein